jgi:hypothetical protein
MPEFLDPVRYLGNMSNHQKMYDFERDMIRVRNPLQEDFEFVYDMLPIVVPAQGTKDMERYLVRRYVWNMIGHIYNIFAEEKMKKAEEAFRRNHPDVMDDPYLINTQIYDKMKQADDPEFQKKVIADCVIGVVSKYGSDRKPPKAVNSGRLDPDTPLYQSLIDGFKTLVDTPEPSSQPFQQQPISPTQMLG